MIDNNNGKPVIDPKHWYPAEEAAPFLGIRDATLKNRLRKGSIKGRQQGPKKVWHVSGAEIKRVRKEWQLD